MGNTFLQMFMRGAPAALRAVQGFGAKAAPKVVQRAADTVTNPQTYRSLAAKAENVLQRGLPAQFAGPNFGGIPTRLTGLISDVAGMPAGVQRSVQAGMVNRAIQEAAGVAPQLARSVQQYSTGALRAPVIGDTIRTVQSVATAPLQTAIQTGGQFARDPALRREFLKQFGGTSEKAARALAGGGGQVGSLMQNLAPGGVTGLRGTTVLGGMGGMAWGLADPTPMIEAGHFLERSLQDRGLIYDPRQDSRVNSIQNRSVVNPSELKPDYTGSRDRAFRFAQYQGMGQTIPGSTPQTVPGGVTGTRAGQVLAGASVPIQGQEDLSTGSPAAERAYQQEKSRVAQLTAQDPELQRYENARLKAIAPGAAPGQVQSAEDIGMQIWRQKYQGTPMAAQGGAVGSFNPLMQRTFDYQTGMSPVQMAELQKTAAPIPVAEGAVPYQAGDLGTRAALETGYDPAAYGLTPERIEELKNKLLQQKR